MGSFRGVLRFVSSSFLSCSSLRRDERVTELVLFVLQCINRLVGDSCRFRGWRCFQFVHLPPSHLLSNSNRRALSSHRVDPANGEIFGVPFFPASTGKSLSTISLVEYNIDPNEGEGLAYMQRVKVSSRLSIEGKARNGRERDLTRRPWFVRILEQARRRQRSSSSYPSRTSSLDQLRCAWGDEEEGSGSGVEEYLW